MKVGSILILLVALFVSLTFVARAQDNKSAADRAQELRTQLQEVQAQEADLQARLKQLDEDLKPENIERYFAGVGSTRPEDLRALRKSQLEREKASVQNQLDQLAGRRARLESAILNADAAAYQQSAQGPETLLAAESTFISPRLIILATVIVFLALVTLIVVMRRARKS